MGSQREISEKRLSRKARLGILALMPFISLGGIALFFQLFYFSQKGSDGFNFGLDALWELGKELRRDIGLEPEKVEDPEINFNLFRSEAKPKPTVKSEFNEPILNTKAENKGIGVNTFYNPSLRRSEFTNFQLQSKSAAQDNFELIYSKEEVARLNRNTLFKSDFEKKIGKWAIGISVAPSYQFRLLSYNTNSDIFTRQNSQYRWSFSQSEKYRKQTDGAILNLSTGIEFYRKLAGRFALTTGVYYLNMGETVQVVSESTSSINNNLPPGSAPEEEQYDFYDRKRYFSPPELNPDMETAGFSNTYSFLQVPLSLHYRAWESDVWNLELSSGVGFSYLVGADAVVYDFESDKYFWVNSGDFPLYRRLHSNLNLGFTLSRFIAENLEIYSNPNYLVNLNSLYTNNYPILQKNWMIGIRLGARVYL